MHTAFYTKTGAGIRVRVSCPSKSAMISAMPVAVAGKKIQCRCDGQKLLPLGVYSTTSALELDRPLRLPRS